MSRKAVQAIFGDNALATASPADWIRLLEAIHPGPEENSGPKPRCDGIARANLHAQAARRFRLCNEDVVGSTAA